MHRAVDLKVSFPKCRHLLEPFAITLDAPEVLIQPDHNIALRCAIGKALESVQRVEERLPAGYHRVDVEASPRLLEKLKDAVFENVAPQRDERGCSIVHYESRVLG